MNRLCVVRSHRHLVSCMAIHRCAHRELAARNPNHSFPEQVWAQQCYSKIVGDELGGCLICLLEWAEPGETGVRSDQLILSDWFSFFLTRRYRIFSGTPSHSAAAWVFENADGNHRSLHQSFIHLGMLKVTAGFSKKAEFTGLSGAPTPASDLETCGQLLAEPGSDRKKSV